MMEAEMKTVVGVFRDLSDARVAIDELERKGVEPQDISLIAGNLGGEHDRYASGAASSAQDTHDVIVTDVTAGAIVGGTAGLVMALTGIVIPGFGAVVAAGWLVSLVSGAAVGAAAGGLVGVLTGAGVPLEDAIYYREGLHRGDTLVVVRAEDANADAVAAILRTWGADDTDVPVGNTN
jgi:hypothetical protein